MFFLSWDHCQLIIPISSGIYFLLKLLGFSNETTWAFSIKQNSRHTSIPAGHEIREQLTVVSRGRPGNSLYNPCLSALCENGYIDKSDHFQLVAE